jgi:hypothetical protein
VNEILTLGAAQKQQIEDGRRVLVKRILPSGSSFTFHHSQYAIQAGKFEYDNLFVPESPLYG